jgi:hypothetical protein
MVLFRTRLRHVIFTLLFCFGCGESQPAAELEYRFAFSIKIKTQDLGNQGISKVPIGLNGQIVGYSNRTGHFEMEYWGVENEEIELSLGELKGYRPITDTTHRVTLQKTTAEGSYIPIPVVVSAQYEMIIKEYFFWIHAECDKTLLQTACRNIPIKLDGEQVAQTETSGYAEFLHAGIPGQTVTVQIQTPDDQLEGEDSVAMVPANPSFSVKLDKEPHVYVIERIFSDRMGGEKTPKSKVSREAAPKKRKSQRPRKRRRKRPKPKPKPSNSGVIDIF